MRILPYPTFYHKRQSLCFHIKQKRFDVKKNQHFRLNVGLHFRFTCWKQISKKDTEIRLGFEPHPVF